MYDGGLFMIEESAKKQIKTQLMEHKGELLAQLLAESKDFKAAVEDLNLNDLGDVASNDIDCRLLDALSTQDKLRLNQVESAIMRMENGKYGVCAKCAGKIDMDRLNAIPWAVMCIDCKSEIEKEKKRKHA